MLEMNIPEFRRDGRQVGIIVAKRVEQVVADGVPATFEAEGSKSGGVSEQRD
jgi:hypothetical protein